VERVVIVGAGLGGMKTAEALRAGDYAGEITMVGAEPHQPYDRPPLSKQVLRGEREPVFLAQPAVFGDLDVDLQLGTAAVGIAGRDVVLDSGDRVGWDRLVLATGAVVKTIPAVPQKGGVHYLRTLDDCRELAAALHEGTRLVVVGGGFIGCEVAASARALGADVTIVEPQPAPMIGAIGAELAALIVSAHEQHGTTVLAGTGVERIEGDDHVTGVVLSDGRTLLADVVVVGVGVRPDTDWLDGSGIVVDDGVVVDDHLRAGVPDVYAVGDVARWYDVRLGEQVRAEHWTNATEMAEVAAANILGGDEVHSPVPYFWSDQYDVKLQSLGWLTGADDVRLLTVGPKQKRVALYGRGGGLWGVAGLNAAMIVRKQHANIAEHVPLDDVVAALLAP
jgi:3-phenylpropionate/trans-cinnamate dioxygenase ferredoxin reductase subunit